MNSLEEKIVDICSMDAKRSSLKFRNAIKVLAEAHTKQAIAEVRKTITRRANE